MYFPVVRLVNGPNRLAFEGSFFIAAVGLGESGGAGITLINFRLGNLRTSPARRAEIASMLELTFRGT